LIELVTDSVRDGDLVKRELSEVAEVRGEQRGQPLVEPTGGERFVGCGIVRATERSKCSALAGGEGEHEGPYQRWDLELAVSFDHADCLGVVFECSRGKERSESAFDSA
jgi:hypothetical protein